MSRRGAEPRRGNPSKAIDPQISQIRADKKTDEQDGGESVSEYFSELREFKGWRRKERGGQDLTSVLEGVDYHAADFFGVAFNVSGILERPA